MHKGFHIIGIDYKVFIFYMSRMRKHIQRKFKENPATVSSIVTIILVITLVILKSVAVWLSGSAAVLSALIDSLSDIALSLMTLISVRWSLKPADDNHRHGHGKVEGLAAMIQSMMLAGGGMFLVLEALGRFVHPVEMTEHIMTIILMLASTLLSVGIAYVQKLGARHSDSLAVEADSLHYSADVIINGSVVLVVLADFTGLFGNWLDPISAIAVAMIMCKTAYEIMIKAFGMLLDEELPEATRNLIIAKIKSHPLVLGLHDLRTSKSGMKTFMSFDIELAPELRLSKAHDISRQIENSLLLDYPNSEIMIHIDPAGDIQDSRHRNL
jgi:ferrous-iron efflux pump FieF